MDAMRLILAVILSAAVTLPPQKVRAQVATINGNEIYADCSGSNTRPPTEQWLLAGTCLGYVTAISDALASGNSVNGFKACVPNNADMNQVMNIVKNFIRDQPERRHLVAAGLVAEALGHAFPCRPPR
jgi:hypothetical protein